MNINSLTEAQIKTVTVKLIEPLHAQKICQSMAVPQFLCDNTQYTQEGRSFFAASIENEFVGMITVQFTAPKNAHINWMHIKENEHQQLIASELLLTVENFCYDRGFTSLTVAALNPDEYEKYGYKLLFKINHSSHLTVYMQKMISLDDFTFIDLTHTLSPDVPHWGVDPAFKYNARYIQGPSSPHEVKFRVQRLDMSAGIGTHMDAPSHCFENASSIDTIPIQSLITVCRVIDVSGKAHERYSVSVDDVRCFEDTYGIIPKGACVIIYTGWDQRWEQPEKYRNNKIFPSISAAAAELLIARDIAGLGIDTLSPDVYGSDFPVHQLILGAGKYIIENVANAKLLTPTGSFIFALPIKILDGTEAPARLIGMIRKL